MGRCRHQSSSWGENASCFDLTWTHGVGGSICSGGTTGNSCRFFGTGLGAPSGRIEVEMAPLPGPTRSHSVTIWWAVIVGWILGAGCKVELSIGLILTSHNFSFSNFTGLSSYSPSLVVLLVVLVGLGERGGVAVVEGGAGDVDEGGDAEAVVVIEFGETLENLSLSDVSSPDWATSTGEGLNLLTEASS